LLTLLALPLGVLLGVGFSAAISRYYVTDLFRIPLAISPRSYLVAAGVVLLATVAGALLMLRQVQHLDLVEALKTRE
jgi:putative ABC transport system permease protein